MTILIIGATGQVGQELAHFLKEKKIPYIGVGSKELDITNQQAVFDYFKRVNPKFVYHIAAYTNVDAAETTEGKIRCKKVNIDGTINIATACEKQQATLFYLSTDYVFDGKQRRPYKVTDKPAPLNYYGFTKYQGEEFIKSFVQKYYIIRTSWVFSEYGHNFVEKIYTLSQKQTALTVISDQIGSPTWARSIAEFLWYITTKKQQYGTYHFSNVGQCSWFEFATEIAKNEQVMIKPINTQQFGQKAIRPAYSVLDTECLRTIDYETISWQLALSTVLRSMTS